MKPVLSVRELTKQFKAESAAATLRPGFQDVSFDIFPGECVGLVGESGCGKTTLARCLNRLIEADAGEIRICGEDIRSMSKRQLRRFRANIQLVFQRPESALNPRMKAGTFVEEALRNLASMSRAERRYKLEELCEQVHLAPHHLGRYPHELSGGQKQRVGLMRALACDPAVVVLDEPTSALDVSVQAAVLSTIKELQSGRSTAFVLISHDLGVVRYVCSRIMIMYLGRIVEEAPTDELFSSARHPYTVALLEAVPRMYAVPRQTVKLSGDASVNAISARCCPLLPRCPLTVAACNEMPPAFMVSETHRVACWLQSDHSSATSRTSDAPVTTASDSTA